MSLRTFEGLEVWKRGCRLAVDVCVETDNWKEFDFRDQIRRSAISIPSNIAEGAERDSEGDFIRFLRISKGSCGELRTQIYIAQRVQERLGKPAAKDWSEMVAETKEISAMLQGLIRSITKRSAQPKTASPRRSPSAKRLPLKTEN